MKVVILAGGRGTRLAEETSVRPKPMVEIGGRPILHHIMAGYAAHGFTDFVVACGYKGEIIKDYFANFLIHNNDYVVDLAKGTQEAMNRRRYDWQVALVDTGDDTMTGGRIRRLKDWLGDGRFMVTYGDGVGDVDITQLVKFHEAHGKLATVTAVRPPARFGELTIEDGRVTSFDEKPQTHAGWINGGFFVFERGVLDYLSDDGTILERDPLQRLARDGELRAYQHEGFWQPMDTIRDRQLLEELWASGDAPWKCET